MAFQAPEDVSINTLVGPGSFIRGELIVSGFIRIDGDIDGNLDATGRIIVGENARIRGDVHSKVITIGGVIQGDVVAPEGVIILSTGMVLGSVLTKKLQIEDTVILHGACFAINDQVSFDRALSDYNNKKALQSSSFSSGRSKT